MHTVTLKFLKVFLVALFAFLLVVQARAIMADGGEWPQFHGDAALNGYSPGKAPDDNNLKWASEDIGAIPSSSPVISGGKVFVNCGDALTCLSESCGSILWSEAINASTVTDNWGSPACYAGYVYIATDKVYCFSENGGEAVWTCDMPSDACNGSVAASGGYVIAGDWYGSQYFCLNASTGVLEWEFTVSGYAQGTPAIVDGKVYLTSWSYVGGHVYCLDLAAGNQVWHTSWVPGSELPDWDTCGSPCVADGKVFLTTYNFQGFGELLALNAFDGSFAWEGTEEGRVRIIERSDSTPACCNGRLYLCGGCTGYSDEGERTYCFDASNGNLIWQTAVDEEEGALDVGSWTCSVAVADGKVFTGKLDRENNCDYVGIYALDIDDGSVVWSCENGGSSPAVCNEVIFTIDDGKVWAFGDPPSYPEWDVNQDGSINVLDMILVGNHFGQTGTPGWLEEDVNSDGDINVLDLILIGNHFVE
ncbi:MAG: PQQ-binding-like beta-propeller repeat protein [Dehalococcoidales bacterium]|nr:PQQ-binding-like beta-propeller repeat protein [Dehalococcoidales bacterium]